MLWPARGNCCKNMVYARHATCKSILSPLPCVCGLFNNLHPPIKTALPKPPCYITTHTRRRQRACGIPPLGHFVVAAPGTSIPHRRAGAGSRRRCLPPHRTAPASDGRRAHTQCARAAAPAAVAADIMFYYLVLKKSIDIQPRHFGKRLHEIIREKVISEVQNSPQLAAAVGKSALEA